MGTFVLDLPPPVISIPGGACHTPHPPISGISTIFQLGWKRIFEYFLKRIFPSKMPLDYTSLRKIICFCEKLKTETLNYLLGAGWSFSRAYQLFHVVPLQASITLSLGFLAFSYLLWSPRFGCMAVIRKPSCLRLRAVSIFFLVRRPKRARHTNYHEPDWRRET